MSDFVQAQRPRVPADASLVEALRDPGAYPHPVQRVEVIETHVSWVLLAGDFAYKVKKPVRLPFLDFSTLERRRHFCEEELRLNRDTAPGIYLDVWAIGGDPPRMGAGGRAREYAVRMRRFPQQALLDRRAAGGHLENPQVDAVADALARFHAAAPRADEASEWASAEAVTEAAEVNLAQMRKLGLGATHDARLARLAEWTRAEAARLAATFAARRAAGFVRECHGDLHMGNVLLLKGEAVLFDRIEFDPALRWIDVMNDVAFLFMDFVRHGEARLAFRLLDRYLQITGDYEGLAVLRFYAVYRALVRAKVAAVRAAQLPGEAGAGARRELDAGLALAERLAQREPTLLVLMHGVTCSGKSTAARRLVGALGAIRLRSDVERKRLHGLEPHARAAAPPGKGIYDAAASDRTYERLEALARSVLAAGYPVLVDASFLERARRERFRAIARELGAAIQTVCCEAPGDVLRTRIERRRAEGTDPSDAGPEVLDYQLATAQPLTDEERRHCIRLDTSSLREWHSAAESFARRFRVPMEP